LLPHSFLLGHLPLVAKIMMKYTPDLHGQMAPYMLALEYPEVAKHGVLYMDVWPVSEPMLAVFHPDMMAQFTQDTSRPKHSLLFWEFYPFTQCKDLVTSEGPAWKRWRSILNPGFSAKNILALVPEMLEEVEVFVRWLEDAAKSDKVIELEPQAMKMTIDVIARAVL
jgi:cytochrome P450